MPALRNPIIPGFNPDPSMICVGTDFFLATSTFEYYPGVPVYHSRDLVNWKLIGHALNRPSQLDLRTVETSGGVYAPTLRHHKGRYYMATSAIHRRSKLQTPLARSPGSRGFYVWTDDIWSNKWSDPVYFDVLGIDQDLFFDDDGKVYQSFAHVTFDPSFKLSVKTSEIDLASGRLLSPAPTIMTYTKGSPICEGPHILKKDGIYYLITANGGTETAHQEWVYRSTAGPFGPWETGPEGSVNPLIFNGNDAEVRQTGHMDMAQGPDGQWWAVFLAVRVVKDGDKEQFSQLGRETFLAPVKWIDGWPKVNGGHPIAINGPAVAMPRLPKNYRAKYTFRPGQDLYRDGWYSIRTPLKKEYDTDTRPGSLALLGGPYDFRDEEAVTMVLQKQTEFKGVWTVDVEYDPEEAGQEAGVTVWWSNYAYASASIRVSSKGKKELVFRRPVDDSDDFKETTCALSAKHSVRFRISADRLEYIFLAAQGDEKEYEVGRLPSRLLDRRRSFDGMFTGTHFGLFAHGAGGIGCRRHAFFSNATWEGVREGGP